MILNNYKTKDGQNFIIRQPNEDDAENIITYSRKLFTSTDQVLTTLEEYTITVDNEKVWINTFNQNANALVLVAELSSQIVGLLFFIPNTKRKNAHTGELGVSVHPHFQGVGIGRLLMQTLLHWAKNNNTIEKVYLNVFATNRNAITLYRNLGFIEEGRHIKAVKQPTGEYVDVLQMYVMTE